MLTAEQETTIRWAADEGLMSLWTAQPVTRRKIERAGYTPYRVSTRKGVEIGWFYSIPLADFRWRLGKRKKQPQTPAQVAAFKRTREAQISRSSSGKVEGNHVEP